MKNHVCVRVLYKQSLKQKNLQALTILYSNNVEPETLAKLIANNTLKSFVHFKAALHYHTSLLYASASDKHRA